MLQPDLTDQQRARFHATLANCAAKDVLRLRDDLGLTTDRHSLRRVRVMLQMTDGVSRSAFNMSEALAIEAWAEIGAYKACLLRLGDEHEAAVAGATILAAIEADPTLVPPLTKALATLERARAAAHSRERAAVRATKIDFEGGEVEAYDANDYSTDR